MRIGELASQAGVSVRALRYYEEQRLLESERTPSGQRVYDRSAVERVRFIQQLYAAGLSSKAVLEILPCVHTGHVTPELMARLTTERDRIAHQIAELSATRDRLDGIISTTIAYRDGQTCAS
ncbi:MerR family transcriptional regulator [Cryptosporangium sp. NPDC048952]|uniref:MerR family transcriptional regulator n=1 Tax=Cryptosporangium sp. NPDC048952 TaxID=3363961 RepID=UPI0037179640